MRFALVALAVVASTPALAAPDFEGAWYVTTTEGTGSCAGGRPGNVTTNVWVVEPAGDAGVAFMVNVSGETAFPRLDGEMNKSGRVTLQGASAIENKGLKGYGANAVWLSVDVKAREFSGVRRFLSLQEMMLAGKRVQVPCFIDLAVTGKRDK